MTYAEYNDQKIIVIAKSPEGEDAVETEGTCVVGNEKGILLKPKGKTAVVLFETASIEDVRFAPVNDKPLKSKSLKPITFGNARQHVLDRHNYTLDLVNSIDEQAAYTAHEGLDHQDLGHIHEAVADTDLGKATEA